jgi:hypothetical protein
VEKELTLEKDRKDSDWFVIPKKVSVPPEFYYYAVDQKDVDKADSKAYDGIHKRDNPAREHQAVFQIHRWLEEISRGRGNNDFNPVAEWTVAERVLVARGEYLGRTERVDVPIWRYPEARFELATPTVGSTKRSKETGIDVDFSLPNDDAVLVDFEGGGTQRFERKFQRDERTEFVKVEDRDIQEVLLVSSDGRVTARNTYQDAHNAERTKRLEQWHARIHDVRQGLASNSGAPNAFSPTGGRQGPARPQGGPVGTLKNAGGD